MKKLLMALCLVGVVFVFAGCQSKATDTTGTGTVEDATITNTSSDASDIGNPPVPPEPTQPTE